MPSGVWDAAEGRGGTLPGGCSCEQEHACTGTGRTGSRHADMHEDAHIQSTVSPLASAKTAPGTRNAWKHLSLFAADKLRDGGGGLGWISSLLF